MPRTNADHDGDRDPLDGADAAAACSPLRRFVPAATSSRWTASTRADGLRGSVLIIGFGRFAQVVSQSLLARGIDVSIIDNDIEMIQAAGDFGFKVYYGDGTRLDVLRAAGAGEAGAIWCASTTRGRRPDRRQVKAEFPLTKLFVRAYDRGHALGLVQAGVDYQLRETFGEGHGVRLRRCFASSGVPPRRRRDRDDVRRRDEERFTLPATGGLTGRAGSDARQRAEPRALHQAEAQPGGGRQRACGGCPSWPTGVRRRSSRPRSGGQ